MQNIRLEKVTLNIGAGKNQELLEKGVKLLTSIVGIAPVKTITSKRIPEWGLRPGLPIGCKLTLRREKAKEMLKRLLHAKDNVLKRAQFDNCGNVAFGIPEYIDIEGAKYDPEIGIIGLEACVTLERPGFKVKKRRVLPAKIGKNQRITREEAIEFMKNEFGIKIKEEIGEEE